MSTPSEKIKLKSQARILKQGLGYTDESIRNEIMSSPELKDSVKTAFKDERDLIDRIRHRPTVRAAVLAKRQATARAEKKDPPKTIDPTTIINEEIQEFVEEEKAAELLKDDKIILFLTKRINTHTNPRGEENVDKTQFTPLGHYLDSLLELGKGNLPAGKNQIQATNDLIDSYNKIENKSEFKTIFPYSTASDKDTMANRHKAFQYLGIEKALGPSEKMYAASKTHEREQAKKLEKQKDNKKYKASEDKDSYVKPEYLDDKGKVRVAHASALDPLLLDAIGLTSEAFKGKGKESEQLQLLQNVRTDGESIKKNINTLLGTTDNTTTVVSIKGEPRPPKSGTTKNLPSDHTIAEIEERLSKGGAVAEEQQKTYLDFIHKNLKQTINNAPPPLTDTQHKFYRNYLINQVKKNQPLDVSERHYLLDYIEGKLQGKKKLDKTEETYYLNDIKQKIAEKRPVSSDERKYYLSAIVKKVQANQKLENVEKDFYLDHLRNGNAFEKILYKKIKWEFSSDSERKSILDNSGETLRKELEKNGMGLSDNDISSIYEMDATIEHVISLIHAIGSIKEIMKEGNADIDAFKEYANLMEGLLRNYMNEDQAYRFKQGADLLKNDKDRALEKYKEVQVVAEKTNDPLKEEGEGRVLSDDGKFAGQNLSGDLLESAIRLVEEMLKTEHEPVTGNLPSALADADAFTKGVGLIAEGEGADDDLLKARNLAVGAISAGRVELENALAELNKLKTDVQQYIDRYNAITNDDAPATVAGFTQPGKSDLVAGKISSDLDMYDNTGKANTEKFTGDYNTATNSMKKEMFATIAFEDDREKIGQLRNPETFNQNLDDVSGVSLKPLRLATSKADENLGSDKENKESGVRQKFLQIEKDAKENGISQETIEAQLKGPKEKAAAAITKAQTQITTTQEAIKIQPYLVRYAHVEKVLVPNETAPITKVIPEEYITPPKQAPQQEGGKKTAQELSAVTPDKTFYQLFINMEKIELDKLKEDADAAAFALNKNGFVRAACNIITEDAKNDGNLNKNEIIDRANTETHAVLDNGVTSLLRASELIEYVQLGRKQVVLADDALKLNQRLFSDNNKDTGDLKSNIKNLEELNNIFLPDNARPSKQKTEANLIIAAPRSSSTDPQPTPLSRYEMEEGNIGSFWRATTESTGLKALKKEEDRVTLYTNTQGYDKFQTSLTTFKAQQESVKLQLPVATEYLKIKELTDVINKGLVETKIINDDGKFNPDNFKQGELNARILTVNNAISQIEMALGQDETSGYKQQRFNLDIQDTEFNKFQDLTPPINTLNRAKSESTNTLNTNETNAKNALAELKKLKAQLAMEAIQTQTMDVHQTVRNVGVAKPVVNLGPEEYIADQESASTEPQMTQVSDEDLGQYGVASGRARPKYKGDNSLDAKLTGIVEEHNNSQEPAYHIQQNDPTFARVKRQIERADTIATEVTTNAKAVEEARAELLNQIIPIQEAVKQSHEGTEQALGVTKQLQSAMSVERELGKNELLPGITADNLEGILSPHNTTIITAIKKSHATQSQLLGLDTGSIPPKESKVQSEAKTQLEKTEQYTSEAQKLETKGLDELYSSLMVMAVRLVELYKIQPVSPEAIEQGKKIKALFAGDNATIPADKDLIQIIKDNSAYAKFYAYINNVFVPTLGTALGNNFDNEFEAILAATEAARTPLKKAVNNPANFVKGDAKTPAVFAANDETAKTDIELVGASDDALSKDQTGFIDASTAAHQTYTSDLLIKTAELTTALAANGRYATVNGTDKNAIDRVAKLQQFIQHSDTVAQGVTVSATSEMGKRKVIVKSLEATSDKYTKIPNEGDIGAAIQASNNPNLQAQEIFTHLENLINGLRECADAKKLEDIEIKPRDNSVMIDTAHTNATAAIQACAKAEDDAIGRLLETYQLRMSQFPERAQALDTELHDTGKVVTLERARSIRDQDFEGIISEFNPLSPTHTPYQDDPFHKVYKDTDVGLGQARSIINAKVHQIEEAHKEFAKIVADLKEQIENTFKPETKILRTLSDQELDKLNKTTAAITKELEQVVEGFRLALSGHKLIDQGTKVQALQDLHNSGGLVNNTAKQQLENIEAENAVRKEIVNQVTSVQKDANAVNLKITHPTIKENVIPADTDPETLKLNRDSLNAAITASQVAIGADRTSGKLGSIFRSNNMQDMYVQKNDQDDFATGFVEFERTHSALSKQYTDQLKSMQTLRTAAIETANAAALGITPPFDQPKNTPFKAQPQKMATAKLVLTMLMKGYDVGLKDSKVNTKYDPEDINVIEAIEKLAKAIARQTSENELINDFDQKVEEQIAKAQNAHTELLKQIKDVDVKILSDPDLTQYRKVIQKTTEVYDQVRTALMQLEVNPDYASITSEYRQVRIDGAQRTVYTNCTNPDLNSYEAADKEQQLRINLIAQIKVQKDPIEAERNSEPVENAILAATVVTAAMGSNEEHEEEEVLPGFTKQKLKDMLIPLMATLRTAVKNCGTANKNLVKIKTDNNKLPADCDAGKALSGATTYITTTKAEEIAALQKLVDALKLKAAKYKSDFSGNEFTVTDISEAESLAQGFDIPPALPDGSGDDPGLTALITEIAETVGGIKSDIDVAKGKLGGTFDTELEAIRVATEDARKPLINAVKNAASFKKGDADNPAVFSANSEEAKTDKELVEATDDALFKSVTGFIDASASAHQLYKTNQQNLQEKTQELSASLQANGRYATVPESDSNAIGRVAQLQEFIEHSDRVAQAVTQYATEEKRIRTEFKQAFDKTGEAHKNKLLTSQIKDAIAASNTADFDDSAKLVEYINVLQKDSEKCTTILATEPQIGQKEGEMGLKSNPRGSSGIVKTAYKDAVKDVEKCREDELNALEKLFALVNRKLNVITSEAEQLHEEFYQSLSLHQLTQDRAIHIQARMVVLKNELDTFSSRGPVPEKMQGVIYHVNQTLQGIKDKIDNDVEQIATQMEQLEQAKQQYTVTQGAALNENLRPATDADMVNMNKSTQSNFEELNRLSQGLRSAFDYSHVHSSLINDARNSAGMKIHIAEDAARENNEKLTVEKSIRSTIAGNVKSIVQNTQPTHTAAEAAITFATQFGNSRKREEIVQLPADTDPAALADHITKLRLAITASVIAVSPSEDHPGVLNQMLVHENYRLREMAYPGNDVNPAPENSAKEAVHYHKVVKQLGQNYIEQENAMNVLRFASIKCANAAEIAITPPEGIKDKLFKPKDSDMATARLVLSTLKASFIANADQQGFPGDNDVRVAIENLSKAIARQSASDELLNNFDAALEALKQKAATAYAEFKLAVNPGGEKDTKGLVRKSEDQRLNGYQSSVGVAVEKYNTVIKLMDALRTDETYKDIPKDHRDIQVANAQMHVWMQFTEPTTTFDTVVAVEIRRREILIDDIKAKVVTVDKERNGDNNKAVPLAIEAAAKITRDIHANAEPGKDEVLPGIKRKALKTTLKLHIAALKSAIANCKKHEAALRKINKANPQLPQADCKVRTELDTAKDSIEGVRKEEEAALGQLLLALKLRAEQLMGKPNWSSEDIEAAKEIQGTFDDNFPNATWPEWIRPGPNENYPDDGFIAPEGAINQIYRETAGVMPGLGNAINEANTLQGLLDRAQKARDAVHKSIGLNDENNLNSENSIAASIDDPDLKKVNIISTEASIELAEISKQLIALTPKLTTLKDANEQIANAERIINGHLIFVSKVDVDSTAVINQRITSEKVINAAVATALQASRDPKVTDAIAHSTALEANHALTKEGIGGHTWAQLSKDLTGITEAMIVTIKEYEAVDAIIPGASTNIAQMKIDAIDMNNGKIPGVYNTEQKAHNQIFTAISSLALTKTQELQNLNSIVDLPLLDNFVLEAEQLIPQPKQKEPVSIATARQNIEALKQAIIVRKQHLANDITNETSKIPPINDRILGNAFAYSEVMDNHQLFGYIESLPKAELEQAINRANSVLSPGGGHAQILNDVDQLAKNHGYGVEIPKADVAPVGVAFNDYVEKSSTHQRNAESILGLLLMRQRKDLENNTKADAALQMLRAAMATARAVINPPRPGQPSTPKALTAAQKIFNDSVTAFNEAIEDIPPQTFDGPTTELIEGAKSDIAIVNNEFLAAQIDALARQIPPINNQFLGDQYWVNNGICQPNGTLDEAKLAEYILTIPEGELQGRIEEATRILADDNGDYALRSQACMTLLQNAGYSNANYPTGQVLIALQQFRTECNIHFDNAKVVLNALKTALKNTQEQKQGIQQIVNTLGHAPATNADFRDLPWDDLLNYQEAWSSEIQKLQQAQNSLEAVESDLPAIIAFRDQELERIRLRLESAQLHLVEVNEDKFDRIQIRNNEVISAIYHSSRAIISAGLSAGTSVPALSLNHTHTDYTDEYYEWVDQITESQDRAFNQILINATVDINKPLAASATVQTYRDEIGKVNVILAALNVAEQKLLDSGLAKPPGTRDIEGYLPGFLNDHVTRVDNDLAKIEKLKIIAQQKIDFYKEVDALLAVAKEQDDRVLDTGVVPDANDRKSLVKMETKDDDQLDEYLGYANDANLIYSSTAVEAPGVVQRLDALLNAVEYKDVTPGMKESVVNFAKGIIVNEYIALADEVIEATTEEDKARQKLIQGINATRDERYEDYSSPDVETAIYASTDPSIDYNVEELQSFYTALVQAIQQCNQDLYNTFSDIYHGYPRSQASQNVKDALNDASIQIHSYREEEAQALRAIQASLDAAMENTWQSFLPTNDKFWDTYGGDPTKIPYLELQEIQQSTAEYFRVTQQTLQILQADAKNYSDFGHAIPTDLQEAIDSYAFRLNALNHQVFAPVQTEILRRDQIAVIEVMKARAGAAEHLLRNFKFPIYDEGQRITLRDHANMIYQTVADDYVASLDAPISQDYINNAIVASNDAGTTLEKFLTDSEAYIEKMKTLDPATLVKKGKLAQTNEILGNFISDLQFVKNELEISIDATRDIPFDATRNTVDVAAVQAHIDHIDQIINKVKPILAALATPVPLVVTPIVTTLKKMIAAKGKDARGIFRMNVDGLLCIFSQMNDLDRNNLLAQIEHDQKGKDAAGHVRFTHNGEHYSLFLHEQINTADPDAIKTLLGENLDAYIVNKKASDISSPKADIGKEFSSYNRYDNIKKAFDDGNYDNLAAVAAGGLPATLGKKDILAKQMSDAVFKRTTKAKDHIVVRIVPQADLPQDIKDKAVKKSQLGILPDKDSVYYTRTIDVKFNDNEPGIERHKIYDDKNDNHQFLAKWESSEPMIIKFIDTGKEYLVTAKLNPATANTPEHVGYYMRELKLGETAATLKGKIEYDPKTDTAFLTTDLKRDVELAKSSKYAGSSFAEVGNALQIHNTKAVLEKPVYSTDIDLSKETLEARRGKLTPP